MLASRSSILAADDRWHRELVLEFGPEGASAARLGPENCGEPGTPLRAAYEAWRAECEATAIAQGDRKRGRAVFWFQGPVRVLEVA